MSACGEKKTVHHDRCALAHWVHGKKSTSEMK